jgi:hypothetical protein
VSYDNFRALAQRLLDPANGRGRLLTIKRTTPGSVDSTSGRPAASTDITAVVFAIIFPWSDRVRYGADRLAASLFVKEGERLMYVSATGMTVTGASDFTPQANDIIVEQIDGDDWKIDRKETLDPDGTGPILHACVLKA